MEFLNILCCANGCSGNEKNVAGLIADYVRSFADSVTTDALGNLIVHKKGNGKKLMFVAHMDEVGFFTTISSEKNIKVATVGDIDIKKINNILIKFENGNVGIMTAEKADKISEYNVDLLAPYTDLTGITAVYDENFKIIGDSVVSKALSSRACCYCLTQIIKQLNSDYDLYFVFTVKKNIGMKGAKVAAFGIKPDYAVVIDAISADMPSVVAKDKHYIVDNVLKTKLSECGFGVVVDKELATEGSVLQVTGDGVKTSVIGINVKYINTPNETCKISDINNTIDYLKKFIEKEI